jgi:F-type H+-transporting ATPase subunit delta
MSSDAKQAKLAEGARRVTVLDESARTGARTYADALLNVAAHEGQVDAVLAELDEILTDVVEPHPQFAGLLLSPLLPAHERDRILVQLFEGRALPTVVKFLRVLARHGRLPLFRAIVDTAHHLWNERQNRKSVSVRTAVALDDEQQTRLRERLQAMLGATPLLSVQTDPELIGGMVIQVGDVVYDSSVRTQLSRMRRSLVNETLQSLRSTLSARAVEA